MPMSGAPDSLLARSIQRVRTIRWPRRPDVQGRHVSDSLWALSPSSGRTPPSKTVRLQEAAIGFGLPGDDIGVTGFYGLRDLLARLKIPHRLVDGVVGKHDRVERLCLVGATSDG
jgi:hypothetical protein